MKTKLIPPSDLNNYAVSVLITAALSAILMVLLAERAYACNVLCAVTPWYTGNTIKGIYTFFFASLIMSNFFKKTGSTKTLWVVLIITNVAFIGLLKNVIPIPQLPSSTSFGFILFIIYLVITIPTIAIIVARSMTRKWLIITITASLFSWFGFKIEDSLRQQYVIENNIDLKCNCDTPYNHIEESSFILHNIKKRWF